MLITLGLQYLFVTGLVALLLVICVVLILTILIQKPQGGGLSGAFGAGGGGAGQTAFGTKTGDALTIATIAMFVLFLGAAIVLNFAARPENIDGRSPTPDLIDPGIEDEVAEDLLTDEDPDTSIGEVETTDGDPAVGDPAETEPEAEIVPETVPPASDEPETPTTSDPEPDPAGEPSGG